MPLCRVGIGILGIGHVGPVFSGPGQAMETLGELDIWQFGQPDFHCLDPNVDQGLCVRWCGHVGLIGDLVEVGVVPAREVDGVTPGIASELLW